MIIRLSTLWTFLGEILETLNEMRLRCLDEWLTLENCKVSSCFSKWLAAFWARWSQVPWIDIMTFANLYPTLLEELKVQMCLHRVLFGRVFLRISEILWNHLAMHSNTGRSDYYCSRVATEDVYCSMSTNRACTSWMQKKIGNWCINDFWVVCFPFSPFLASKPRYKHQHHLWISHNMNEA